MSLTRKQPNICLGIPIIYVYPEYIYKFRHSFFNFYKGAMLQVYMNTYFTEKSFPNLVEWNLNQIIITIFRLIWIARSYFGSIQQNSEKKLLSVYTQRNLFEKILNQPKIRLYLPFSDWFHVDLIRIRKYFSALYLIKQRRNQIEQLVSIYHSYSKLHDNCISF